MPMKSPFPGMDPYIEACGLWEGFHERLIHKIDEALARILPRGYTTHIGVRGYVVMMEEEGKSEQLAKPDVAVTQRSHTRKPRGKKGGTAVAESGEYAGSVSMQAFIAERFRETFVEIYLQGEERMLITSIEILSPSNKRPATEGWKEYERKRQAMLFGQCNFIELDLLRGGRKMPMRTRWPEAPYSLLVSWQMKAPYCRVWPAHFNSPLPAIPVPLLYPEPDLRLDLQPLIDEIYALGRYDELVNYDRPLEPALPDEDTAWVREQLRRRARK
jgi:hypothetical protein